VAAFFLGAQDRGFEASPGAPIYPFGNGMNFHHAVPSGCIRYRGRPELSADGNTGPRQKACVALIFGEILSASVEMFLQAPDARSEKATGAGMRGIDNSPGASCAREKGFFRIPVQDAAMRPAKRCGGGNDRAAAGKED